MNSLSSGGSSFISGHNGCLAIDQEHTTNKENIVHKDNSIYSPNYVFTNTLMIDGNGYQWTNVIGSKTRMPNPNGGYYALGEGHSGNGYAKITLINID